MSDAYRRGYTRASIKAEYDEEELRERIAELEAALRPFADVLRDMRSRGLDPAGGNYVNADVETAAYLAAERLVGAD